MPRARLSGARSVGRMKDVDVDYRSNTDSGTLKITEDHPDNVIRQLSLRSNFAFNHLVISTPSSPTSSRPCSAGRDSAGNFQPGSDPPQAHRMRFRIGINLGDVMVNGSDLYGDGSTSRRGCRNLPSPVASWSPVPLRSGAQRTICWLRLSRPAAPETLCRDGDRRVGYRSTDRR